MSGTRETLKKNTCYIVINYRAWNTTMHMQVCACKIGMVQVLSDQTSASWFHHMLGCVSKCKLGQKYISSPEWGHLHNFYFIIHLHQSYPDTKNYPLSLSYLISFYKNAPAIPTLVTREPKRRAIEHPKIVTTACSEQEILKPEVSLQYQGMLLGATKI